MFAVLSVKKLLFVSIAFPPKNDPECIQTARYFKYLKDTNKFEVTVITSKSPTLYMPVDPSLNKYASESRELIEIPIFENKYLNFALRKIGLGRLLFPDSKMTFHWQWKKVLTSKSERPDFIYSRSNPVSSAFMARRLKQHYQCPWIMHLSDPWAISPLNEISLRDRMRYLSMEQTLVTEADVISVTTEQTRQLYKQKYPESADKFHVLPNVYDPQDITLVQQPSLQKLRVVYTGSLVGKRGVFFIESILKLLSAQLPNYSRKLEFVFAGDVDRANKLFFEKQLPGITHAGLISYAEAKGLCQTAHLLLVVDNPTNSSEAVFFPSKLLDYFLAKRKIWAVTPLNSSTREVLVGYNHEAFEHTDIEGMVQFLMRSINQFESKSDLLHVRDLPEKFNAQLNAEKLTQIILNAKLS